MAFRLFFKGSTNSDLYLSVCLHRTASNVSVRLHSIISQRDREYEVFVCFTLFLPTEPLSSLVQYMIDE